MNLKLAGLLRNNGLQAASSNMMTATLSALFLIIVGMLYLTSGVLTPAVVSAAPPPPASSVVMPDVNFSQVGTLIFYPNNVGPVPYLFYRNASGTTVAKALVFSASSPNDLSSWTGSRILVTGYLDAEHVTVVDSSYVSGP